MDCAALDSESRSGREVELADPQCDMGSGGERRLERNGYAQWGDLVRHKGIQCDGAVLGVMAETGGVEIGGNGFVETEVRGGVELVFDVVGVDLRGGDAYFNPGFARAHLECGEPVQDGVGVDGGLEFMCDWGVAVDFEATDLRDDAVATEEIHETSGDGMHVARLGTLCGNTPVSTVEHDGER